MGPMTARVQEGPIPRGGVVQGPPVFTPRRDKTSVCGCTVGSSAFKTHRRPKKHSSPEVPRIGHSCYTWIGVDTSRRPLIVLLVWLGSQSAVTERRIHQANLLGEGAEHGQTAGDQRVPPVGFEAQQVHFQLTPNDASLV